MFPHIVACDQCGENAVVLEWLPSDEKENQSNGPSLPDGEVCRIHCFECGIHAQRIQSCGTLKARYPR
jgi:hypothetical protein